MTTKSKTKSKSKSGAEKMPATSSMERAALDAELASLHAATPSAGDRRKELLARVAGSVASGLVTSPTESIASPLAMATVAVDIAEEILKKAGITPIVESSEEPSSSPTSPTGEAAVGAAS